MWANLLPTLCVGGPVRAGYFPINKGQEVVLKSGPLSKYIMYLYLSMPIYIFVYITLRLQFTEVCHKMTEAESEERSILRNRQLFPKSVFPFVVATWKLLANVYVESQQLC